MNTSLPWFHVTKHQLPSSEIAWPLIASSNSKISEPTGRHEPFLVVLKGKIVLLCTYSCFEVPSVRKMKKKKKKKNMIFPRTAKIKSSFSAKRGQVKKNQDYFQVVMSSYNTLRFPPVRPQLIWLFAFVVCEFDRFESQRHASSYELKSYWYLWSFLGWTKTRCKRRRT